MSKKALRNKRRKHVPLYRKIGQSPVDYFRSVTTERIPKKEFGKTFFTLKSKGKAISGVRGSTFSCAVRRNMKFLGFNISEDTKVVRSYLNLVQSISVVGLNYGDFVNVIRLRDMYIRGCKSSDIIKSNYKLLSKLPAWPVVDKVAEQAYQNRRARRKAARLSKVPANKGKPRLV